MHSPSEALGHLGVVLGVFKRSDLDDSHLTLALGEMICMFTDGLVEARDGDELFGSEREAALLRPYAEQSPDDLAEALVAD